MKLLVDTDPGTDDCHALTHLLKLSDIVAITTVFGNTSVCKTAQNACRILDMLGMNHIPVYSGAHCSLQTIYQSGEGAQTAVHGSDGMNDVPDIIPETVNKSPEPNMSAPDAIVQIVKSNPGEITLVALGPLTNIAMASRLCPELPNLVKSIYIMGSSSKVGNVTPWAEFNFHCDPLAAHLTLRTFCRSCVVHLVPWEPCLDQDNCLTMEQWDSMFEGVEDSPAKKLIQGTAFTKWLSRRRKEGKSYVFADQLVSLILIHPEAAIDSENYDSANVIYDKNEEQFGRADYVRNQEEQSTERGLIVHTKFDMECLMKMYKNSISTAGLSLK